MRSYLFLILFFFPFFLFSFGSMYPSFFNFSTLIACLHGCLRYKKFSFLTAETGLIAFVRGESLEMRQQQLYLQGRMDNGEGEANKRKRIERPLLLLLPMDGESINTHVLLLSD